MNTAQQLELPLNPAPRLYLVECAHHGNSPNRNIRQNKNGGWEMRVQVLNLQEPKLLGPRLHFSLKTKDVNEARARRDVVIKALEQARAL